MLQAPLLLLLQRLTVLKLQLLTVRQRKDDMPTGPARSPMDRAHSNHVHQRVLVDTGRLVVPLHVEH